MAMGQYSVGPVSSRSFDPIGGWLVAGKGRIHAVSDAMTVPNPADKVLIADSSIPASSLVIGFRRPVSKVFVTRIGVKNGASLPRWRVKALDRNLRVINASGEWEFGAPAQPATFSVSGRGICQIRIETDNRWERGTYATFNGIPITSIKVAR